MSKIKLGLTIYSFTPEYARGILDLEGVIRTAAEMGYTGYEIVATQMCPDYPFVIKIYDAAPTEHFAL